MMVYHYTSIDTLARILKSKKMRFKRLDTVNDMYDGKMQDFKDAQKLMFVSCFTKSNQENIPLWEIYAGPKGVRIGLNDLIFGPPCHKFFNNEIGREQDQNLFGTISDENSVIFGPTEVDYSNEHVEDVIEDRFGGGLKVFYPLKIGNKKSTHWSFEDEVRFKLLSFNAMVGEESIEKLLEKMKRVMPAIDDSIYIDAPVDEKHLLNMEILLGPKTDDADRIIVEALVEKFKINGSVSKSELQIR